MRAERAPANEVRDPAGLRIGGVTPFSTTDWPGCYAAIVDTVETPLPGTVLARLVHRFAASGALVLIGLIAFLALRPASDYPVERKLAWTALAIALSLAALGIWTPGARVPAVAIGNLVGGFALFASLAALSARLREQGPGVAGSAIALVALVVVFAHAMLGGMIGAQFAVTACPPALACPSADFSTLTGSGILDPLRPTRLPIATAGTRAPGVQMPSAASASATASASHASRRSTG